MDYVPSEKDKANINNNFVYHAPKTDQAERYEQIRNEAKLLAEFLTIACPPSRELSVALIELETAVFWANAAIARNE